jgi:diguanylate cyclase (GGDEF)-like protein
VFNDVVTRGASLIIPDLDAFIQDHPSDSHPVEVLRDGFEVESIMVFPARAFGKTHGLTVFGGRHPVHEENRRLLAGISDQLGMALASKTARGSFEAHFRRVEQLSTIFLEISQALTLESSATVIAEGAASVLRAPAAALLLPDDWGETFEVRGSTGLSQRFIERERIQRREIPLTVLAQDGIPFVSRKVRPRGARELELFEGEQIASVLSLPLMGSGRLKGILNVYSRGSVRRFSEEELELAKLFASNASFVLENMYLRAETETRKADASRLFEMGQLLTSSDSLGNIQKLIVSHAAKTLDVKICRFFALDEEAGHMVGKASVGESGEGIEGLRLPLDFSEAIIQAIETLKPVETKYVAHSVGVAREEGPPVLGSSLIVPMVTRGGIFGVLFFEGRLKPRPFSEREIELAAHLANQAAVTIENQRTLMTARQKSVDMKVLSEVGSRIASILDLSELLKVTVSTLRESFGYNYLSVYLVDADSEEIILEETLGFAWEEDRPRRWNLANGGLVPLAARKGETLISDDVQKDPRWAPGPGPAEIRSELVVPLRLEERVIGVLDVQAEEEGAFGDSDVLTLETLASQVAVSLKNAQLYQESEHSATIDPGTELFNRRYLFSVLEREMAKVDRYGRVLSIFIVDIDGFKGYNDRYGHLAGDDLLHELGRIFQSEVRQTDVVGRYGGEEFMFVLAETGKENAVKLAERVRQKVERTSFAREGDVPDRRITISLGVATYPQDATSLEGFIDAADKALYSSKRKGKNCVSAFEG